jgi:hypothetical protein
MDLIYLVDDLNSRRAAIQNYNDYYQGRQKNKFVGAQLQTEFGNALTTLSCNRCAPVVDTIADKLQIEGFTDRSAFDMGDEATTFWTENDMDLISGEVHTEALTTGDAYAIVWPDADGTPIIYPQKSEQIAVLYDYERRQMHVAAKAWRVRGGFWRLNLYYEDRLEKYVSRRPDAILPNVIETWNQYQDEEDGQWPIPHDFGRVPIFHFATNARTGQYGKSELQDIIPLQDRLNQTLANLAIAEEFQSYRQRWATGIQPQFDEEGNPISPFANGSGAGRLWITSEEGVKFGEFSAADLNQFGVIIEGHEKLIARTARIPIHYIVQGGTPPSGEALKTAEAPFQSKIVDRQRSFGAVWADLMDFIMFRTTGKPTRLKTQWKSAEPRSDTDFWSQAVVKREMGVSPVQILKEGGYSDEEIARFPDEMQAFDNTMGDAVARAFNGQ